MTGLSLSNKPDSPRDLKKIGMMAGGGLLAVLVLAFLLWPDSKERKALDRCKVFEAQGSLVIAQEACQEAVTLAPNSRSGKAAAEILKSLGPKANAIRSAEKQKTDPVDPPCKAGKWVTRCIFKGKKRPNPIDGETKARCNQDASELRSNIDDMVCPSCVCLDDFELDGGPSPDEM